MSMLKKKFISKSIARSTFLTLAMVSAMAACQATAPLPQRTFTVDPDDLEDPAPSPILLPEGAQPVNTPLPAITPPPGATPIPTVTANVSPLPAATPFVNPTPPPSWVSLTLQARAESYANLIGEVRMLEAQGRVSNVALLPEYRVQLSASEDVVDDLRSMAR